VRVRTEFPDEIRELRTIWIPMSDGVRLAARMWLPTSTETTPVPAIIEYLPYRRGDGTAARDMLSQGDLGTDAISGRPILTMVMDVLPYTLTLTFAAIGLAVVLGLPLGCFSATHPDSFADRTLALVSVSFIAMPNFVVAIYMLLIFSIWLDWLPVLGASRSGEIGDQLLRLILPTVSLALGWIGYIARLVRSSLLEVLDQNFIRTARAYGLSETKVVYKYALKNAAVPTGSADQAQPVADPRISRRSSTTGQT
jgi:ABC-type dipeptide/oligopeptide/nickel transport system permease component